MKHILVPTDGSEEASLGVGYAVALAKHHGATLHGLHVVDIKLLEGPFLRDISASLGTAPYLNHQGNIHMILEERGKVALQAFEDACNSAGVDFETAMVTGLVSRSIVEKSELADLTVMGRAGEHSPWVEGVLGSTSQSVVRRAKSPVLLTATDQMASDRFMVAYDGSAYARHALKVAASLGGEWQADLTVLVVAPPDERTQILKEATDYLEAYDLPVSYEGVDGDPSEVIAEQAKANEINLLVMGAYGHTKVREWVVGSVTAYVMNHAPCPLLLIR